jgi:hypothetical protein
MDTASSFWSALEQVPDLNAIPPVWISLLGPVFRQMQGTLFRKRAEPAQAVFCENCYCTHEVVRRGPGCGDSSAGPGSLLMAVCRCEGAQCPDIALSPADIEIWELNWASLGRSLCGALELEPQADRVSCPNTRQIGSWSAAALPAFLTIQSEPEELRSAIAELVARLQSPFLLFAPTAGHLNASCRELLAHARAGFFPLDATVQVTARGRFHPAQAPQKLFAELRPQPDESFELATARKAMALVEKLGGGDAPTPFEAFKLYCIEGLSGVEISAEFECSRATVSRRLAAVRRATGKTLAELRGLSPFFEGKEEDGLV